MHKSSVALWVTACSVLLTLFALAIWRQRPLRPAGALLIGMGGALLSLVVMALSVWRQPVAIPQLLSLVLLIFLVLGRGRPLDVMPTDYVTGWSNQEERRMHKVRSAKIANELMLLFVALVVGVVVWIVFVLTGD